MIRAHTSQFCRRCLVAVHHTKGKFWKDNTSWEGDELVRVSNSRFVLLMSGGIDSSATLAACQQIGTDLSGMFFDYGQPAARSEWEAAQHIASHYRIGVEKVALGVSLASDRGEFFGRNALFVLTAAGVIPHRPLTVAIGIHALSDYYDTKPLFVKHMERLLNGYSGGTVSLYAPFLADSKAEIIKFAREAEVPLQLTHSCERQNAPACMECPSCLDRIEVDGG